MQLKRYELEMFCVSGKIIWKRKTRFNGKSNFTMTLRRKLGTFLDSELIANYRLVQTGYVMGIFKFSMLKLKLSSLLINFSRTLKERYVVIFSNKSQKLIREK